MCVEKDSLSNGNKSLGLSGEEQGKGHKQNCLHVLERLGFPEAFDILMSTCDPTLQAESNHRFYCYRITSDTAVSFQVCLP